jgi:AbrB family looped-hinge helix DNA binding protein
MTTIKIYKNCGAIGSHGQAGFYHARARERIIMPVLVYLPMNEKMVIIKEVDKQGRMVIPKKWRESHGIKKVMLRVEGDRIMVLPYRPPDITKFFDRVEVDVESDLRNWKAIKRELDEIR